MSTTDQDYNMYGHSQSGTFSRSTTQAVTETSPLVISTKASEEDVSVNIFIKSGKELKKSLGLKHAFACIVSILFGSGIFISPSLVARQTSNMGMALLAWVIAGIPSLFGALCFCELACMYKKIGSYYLFILEAYGKVLAFMIIFIQVIIIIPSAFSILSLAIGEHIIDVIPGIDNFYRTLLVKVISILSVVIATAINCVSAEFVGKTQIIFSVIQSLSAVFLVVLGISEVASGHFENFTVMFNNTKDFNIGQFGLALYNALWAFDGWGVTASIAEELKNLERDLWLSFIIGIPFVIICYLFINLALISALTRKEIIESETVATTFVAKVLGRKASYIIPAAVAFSCFGCLVGATFMNARDFLSASREGQLPIAFSYIHRDRRTPIPALIFILTLSIIWMLPPANGLETLITYFSIGVWLKYGLAIFSVIVMRKRKPDMERPFKVWLANPIFTSLFSLFLIVIPFVKRPIESTVSLLLFLTALPVYYVFIKKHDSLPSCVDRASDALVAFLKYKCNLVPCVFKEDTHERNKDEVDKCDDTEV